jgi:hypothetical protein
VEVFGEMISPLFHDYDTREMGCWNIRSPFLPSIFQRTARLWAE